MQTEGFSLKHVEDFIGKELGVSEWLTIDQGRINQFADCTDDQQWIHVDIEKAERESPFGATIAHGYLTLALLSRFQYEVGIVPEGANQAFNYGLDKVRFLAPVKAGDRIRCRISLLDAARKDSGVLLKIHNALEIEGNQTQALIAESLALIS